MWKTHLRLGPRASLRAAALLALGTAGGFALVSQGCGGQEAAPAKPPAAKGEYDWRAARYQDPACATDAMCRQLKRIWEEGGTSEEAVRENFRAADSGVSFEQVEEDSARYEGTACAFKAEIVDIIDEQRNSLGEHILAEIVVDGDRGKLVSVRADYRPDVAENDQVYVVGYLTGQSRPRLGTVSAELQGRRVVTMAARSFLKPGEAMKYID